MTIWNIIAFLVGGLCGFVLCAMFAGNAISELESEIFRLMSKEGDK